MLLIKAVSATASASAAKTYRVDTPLAHMSTTARTAKPPTATPAPTAIRTATAIFTAKASTKGTTLATTVLTRRGMQMASTLASRTAAAGIRFVPTSTTLIRMATQDTASSVETKTLTRANTVTVTTPDTRRATARTKAVNLSLSFVS